MLNDYKNIKINILSLGCKVNQYESGKIAELLSINGYTVITSLQYADIYIINTCAVTNEAERKSRQAVNRVLKYNPNAKVIIIGCASQANSKQFTNGNISYISGTADKLDIVNKINELGCNIEIPETKYIDCGSLASVSDKRKCLIKIQDGCNNFCSYCIVPYLRGRSRSRNSASLISEINANKNKFKEFVLVGIDISSFGKDTNSSLTQLISKLPSGIILHIGSLEVNIINQELMDVLRNFDSFSGQFHLSAQSGSDSVLKRMNRHYTSRQYIDAVNLIRNNFPNAVITTDLIVGFPMETDDEFNQTVEFVKAVNFNHAHIFPYSPKSGTAAASMKQVDSGIIKKRVEILNKTVNI